MILLLADSAVLTVAILHIVFMVLEMLFWNKPTGHSIFGLKPDFAHRTRTLAANLGLYDGFLAAGLIWSLLAGPYAFNLQVFFLGCVIIAGILGGLTTHRLITWIQAPPGTIALVLVFLAQSTY
jgi:putative membrane protein